ncbi:MAG: hypothetical protein KIS92_03710 [Planctomycetota bacterium]|nr:hypothetical protein [Planctomycetota bacterium]
MSQAESDPAAHLNTEGASAPEAKAVPFSTEPIDQKPPPGPRGWFLPVLNGPPWFVLAEDRPESFARALKGRELVLYAADRDAPAREEQGRRGLAASIGWLSEERYEAWFRLARHALLAGGLVLVGLIGLRVPGRFKILDDLLLVFSAGYLFVALRRGWRELAACEEHLRAARRAFKAPHWSAHPLLERLADALAYRSNLPPEQRGHQPDAELLDLDAYRKLVDEGVVTAEELAALGNALSARLGLAGRSRAEVKITEVAREAGLDDETAVFYLDLATAASQLSPPVRLNT